MALIVLNAFLFNIKLRTKTFRKIFTNRYKTLQIVGNHTTRYANLLYNDEFSKEISNWCIRLEFGSAHRVCKGFVG